MILFKDESGIKTFPVEGVSINDNIIKNISSDVIILNIKGNVIIKDKNGNKVTILFPGESYKVEEEVDIVNKYLKQTKSLDNVELFKLMINLKEYSILRALYNIDQNNIDTLVEYEQVLNEKSKNSKFIRDLSVYNIINNPDEFELFKKIFDLRMEIFDNMEPGEKNHIIYGFNNPFVWLDIEYRTKRILAGCIQYRKGLHRREFELAILNIGLINKFPLTDAKIEYANIMRDYGLV